MGKIKCIDFPNPYQYLQVNVGETKEVWRMDVNAGYAAFIERLACDWFATTYINFIVDGKLIEKVLREIPINDPEPVEPPIVAVKQIRWIAHNESSLNHEFGVLTKGRLCRIRKT